MTVVVVGHLVVWILLGLVAVDVRRPSPRRLRVVRPDSKGKGRRACRQTLRKPVTRALLDLTSGWVEGEIGG